MAGTRHITKLLSVFASATLLSCGSEPGDTQTTRFQQAIANGKSANEGFIRCRRYLGAWLKLADPITGLIPRSTQHPYWNPEDSAADNYPYMVLAAWLTDRPLFEGAMKEILRTEIELTSRLDRLPDTYMFSTQTFRTSTLDLRSITFGSAEYVKDGLLAITEYLGPSPWSDRMIAILDDMWKHAAFDTPAGRIVSYSPEVNGNVLQALARVYWLTGKPEYLEWAVGIGDHYLLGDHHPTRDATHLRLRDHGCEIVLGLCELYATVSIAMPAKKSQYRKHIHEMLDRILEVGRNDDGFFYGAINPREGSVADKRLADTWGYLLNAFYTVYLIDNTQAYREATRTPLLKLDTHYRSYRWEEESGDGNADAIEGALYLYNRERIPSVATWIDSQLPALWVKQHDDGTIFGSYGDGNFARTTIMYCLWKTRGVRIQPWRGDVVFGGVSEADDLWLAIKSGKDWTGRVILDGPRHKTGMKLPFDWPRINQLPEWYTVDAEKKYMWTDASSGNKQLYTGKQLHEGIRLNLKAGKERHFHIELESDQ